MLCSGTRIHECLSNHREARIHCCCFVDVKYKVRVLDKIYPKPQWKTVKESTFYLNTFINRNYYYKKGYTSILRSFCSKYDSLENPPLEFLPSCC
jgi:hypothetical protein